MKNKLAIGALLLLVAVMLASFSSAMADTFAPLISISNQEIVWTIDTLKLFSGKEVFVTTITVEYWYYPDPENPVLTYGGFIYPIKVGQGNWQIKLWFDPATFPNGAEFSVVKGQIAGGDDFSAQGPGWAYRYY